MKTEKTRIIKFYSTATLCLTVLLSSCNKTMQNPLLQESTAPFGAPQFDKIKPVHYLPAFEYALAQAKEEIDAIAGNPEDPDFTNTIEALESAGRLYNDIGGIFYNVLEADATPELQEIAEKVSPLDNELSTYVNTNRKLFEKVKTVYGKRESLGLDQEKMKLLEETYKGFVRNGADLSEADQKELSAINEQLSLLSLEYSRNLLTANNSFVLHITDSTKLAGLPDYVVKQGVATAADHNLDGWAYDLSAPSYSAFMKFSSQRELREQLYRAYNTRGLAAESDNRPVVRKLVELRLRKANLLGYASWADYVISDRMAGSKQGAYEFLEKLKVPTMPVAKEEVLRLQDYAKAHGFEGEALQAWDFSYWAEKMKNDLFSISDEDLKPFFNMEACIPAVFDLAHRLYGINFKERKDIPVYHKDVKVYEVTDADGSHLALFYADFYPRDTKRGGAWMTQFRGQRFVNGQEQRPFISIVTNLTKPTADEPALITHSDLTTFLHEFGHSLHGMLAKGHYESLTGTNVNHDFVELPSQIMENWGFQSEYLSSFARHYKTGEVIPQQLIDKIIAAQNYMSAYYQARQLTFGYLDLAWHSLTEMTDKDVLEFEKEAIAPVATLPIVDGCCISTSISHLFSGGYSAGYYSYKWAEVLAADAFSLFEEKGIFDGHTSRSFRHLLEVGAVIDESQNYREFRGHDPEPEALLRQLGITE